MKSKTLLTLLVTLTIGLTLSAFMPKEPVYKAKNLTVLPKNSSKEDIEEVMESFKVALGVKCGFCHAPKADDPTKLDFASDAKPEKEMARKMMRMTAKLNKKYFHNQGENGMMINISCQTCHNGNKEPHTVLKGV